MNIVRYIDHTLLRPDATPYDVAEHCEKAREYHFASVCINPAYVPMATQILAKSDVAVGTVIGFPLGATSSGAKLCEATIALRDGAQELDMVINIGRLKTGDCDYVLREIRDIVELAVKNRASIKVIIETHFLTEEEKSTASRIAQIGGAHFVKTCTGFSGGKATVADVLHIRSVVSSSMGVKASGGIATYADAMALIKAGATRIGTSKGLAIASDALRVACAID